MDIRSLTLATDNLFISLTLFLASKATPYRKTFCVALHGLCYLCMHLPYVTLKHGHPLHITSTHPSDLKSKRSCAQVSNSN